MKDTSMELLEELKELGCKCELLREYLNSYRIFTYVCKVEGDLVIVNTPHLYWREKLPRPVYYSRCFNELLEEGEFELLADCAYEMRLRRFKKLETEREVIIYGY